MKNSCEFASNRFEATTMLTLFICSFVVRHFNFYVVQIQIGGIWTLWIANIVYCDANPAPAPFTQRMFSIHRTIETMAWTRHAPTHTSANIRQSSVVCTYANVTSHRHNRLDRMWIVGWCYAVYKMVHTCSQRFSLFPTLTLLSSLSNALFLAKPSEKVQRHTHATHEIHATSHSHRLDQEDSQSYAQKEEKK